MRVPKILEEAAETYRQRNVLYGDSYKMFGQVMVSLFPTGLEVRTAEEWNKIGVLTMMVSKLTRLSANIGIGHIDSAHDLSVYSAMLQELFENDHL